MQNNPNTNPAPERDIILKVEHLTKMFGRRKSQAKEMQAKGRSRDDILKETGVTIAVDDVSFEAERGKTFSLIGLSGSGKSTVVRCLNLLWQPTEGSIFFNGENIADYSPQQLMEYRRKHISMVFQSFGLLSHRDVLDNVAYGLEIRGIDKKKRTDAAMRMIEMVNLKGWENKNVGELSGGMR